MGSSQSTRKITLVNDESAGVIKLSESLAYRLRGQILDGQSSASSSAATTGDQANSLSTESKYPSVPIPSDPPPPSLPLSTGSPSKATTVPFPVVPFVDTNEEDLTPSIQTSPPPIPSSEGGSSPASSTPVAPAPVLPPTPPPTPPPKDTTAPSTDLNSKGSVPQIQLNGNGGSSWNLYAEEAQLAMLRLREEKDEQLKSQEEEWRGRLANREKEYMNQAQLTQDSINKSIANVESLFLKTSFKPICQEKQDEVRECFAANPKQPLKCAEIVRQFRACVNLNQLQAVLNERTS